MYKSGELHAIVMLVIPLKLDAGEIMSHVL